jgi:RHS repeat-associated protein
VTAISHQLTAVSSQINKAEYGYNAVGNRTSLTDRRGAQTFGYDPLDRLTSASHPLLGTPQAFAYDPVGNRTTGGSVVNAGNQLTADATHSYQYDDNGNLTRKTLLATGNFTQYTYDAENRLTKVEDFVAGNPTPAFTSTYRYDGLGRRIEKIGNGVTRRYVYDRDQILLEYDGANVLQARYTYGPRTDEPIAVTRGANTFFYHANGLDSVTDLTDGSGATVQSYAYDAWGNVLDQIGSIENPFTYTGREQDTESGLFYYRARSYDPNVGRFLEPDPIGFGGDSPNLYLYVRDNPTNFTDPLGLWRRLPIPPIRPPLGNGPASCSYYDQVSNANGGQCPYYSKTAPFVCRNARALPMLIGVSNTELGCIRNNLIKYDQLFQQDSSNLSSTCPKCMKDSIIEDYHRAAYSQCGVAPWRFVGLLGRGNGNGE